jgi:hypothetical protein
LIALDNAQIKYSTVQNWDPGDKDGKGGIFNFVTKRGACRGINSKISWTQVETSTGCFTQPAPIIPGIAWLASMNPESSSPTVVPATTVVGEWYPIHRRLMLPELLFDLMIPG